MRLAFRLAGRELRGGARGLWIVLACLVLGVAAIAAVGSLRAGIAAGLAADGRRLLGGDIEVAGGGDPLPAALSDMLRARGATLSDVTGTRSMLIAPSGERQLVELKAVDPAYPLVGEAVLDPPASLADALAARDGTPGLVAEQVVLDRLGVHPGDTLRLGQSTVTVRGRLVTEPDRVASPTVLAPRAMIAAAALPGTALVQPGSLVQHNLRAVLPPGTDIGAVAEAIGTGFPGSGWRVRTADQAAPGVARFIDQTALFMTLVGLTALLVGGIGVANGVQAWLLARARTYATLRCLGASSRLVFAVALLQVLALSLVAVVVGVALGALLPLLATTLFGDALPVPPRAGLYPVPLALSAVYGLLVALSFALWPLARAAQIPGAALFRRRAARAPERPPAAAGAERAAGRGAGGADRAYLARSGLRTVVLRRRCGHAAAVPPGRGRAGLGGGARTPAKRGLGTAGPRQSVPAGGRHAAAAGVAGPWPFHPGRRGAHPGQSPPPGAGPAPGARADLFLYRRAE